jgi:hypothetical protein
MCNQEWAKINPGAVPSRCMMYKRKALMNVGKTISEDPDRIACANNFLKHLAEGKSLNGKAVHANEIVAQYYLDSPEEASLEAQWKDLRAQFEGCGSSKFIAMADVSGSMLGGSSDIAKTPMVNL